MKLRTVEMVGFKSFRDRVKVEISDGITCIVGPNGCGKSNVVDAIKWAMGEMSPKSLRGDSLSDVIFAGTEKRKPAGMAEVTLTFDNTGDDDAQTTLEGIGDEQPQPDGESDEADELDLGRSIPREFQNLAEIAITRRLHRDGKSEYLINKVSCRLRDIRNLLAGTGLGKQGYSIIEQGQIGFIVNARPSERRLIIEEASGITRYKDRRKRAARKLDRTEQNLQRTRDILEEIEGQMETLQKQAEKAREHKKLSAELEALEVALLVDRRAEAAATDEKLGEKLKEARKASEEVQKKLVKTEKNLEEARKKADQADSRHNDLTENYYKVETRLNLAQSNRKHARETRRDAEQRRQELVEEQKRQQQRREHLQDELQRARRELEDVDDQPDNTDNAVDALEEKRNELRNQRSQAARRRDELRRGLNSRRTRLERVDDRLEWIDEQFDELDDRTDTVAREIEEIEEERTDLQRSISRLTVDHERARETIAEHQSRLEDCTARLERHREELQQAREHEQKLARRKMELETRIDSLEKMRRRGEGYEEGVRRILEWAQENDRDDVFGPAGDFLQVPEGLESAYAAFIGDRIGDLLVADRRVALEALSVLDDEEAGRVGCFPVGQHTPEALVQSWVEKLEVVDSLDEVPDAVGDTDVQGWATPRGDVVFADGRVVGGGVGDRAETLLRQVRQLERMREQLGGVQRDHDEAVERLELQREEVEVIEQRAEAARDQLRDSKHQARQLEQDLDGVQREKSRADKRFVRLGSQRDELKQRRQQLIEERDERAGQRDELLEAIPKQQEAFEQHESKIERLDERIDELDEELTEHKIRVAQVDERRRHLVETVERLQKDLAEATQRIERIADEIEEQKSRGEEAKMRAETLDGEVERLQRDHDKLEQEVAEVSDVVDELHERVEALELAVLGRRQDVEEAKENVQTIKMDRREAQMEVEHATEQLMERFELELAEARRKTAAVDVAPDERKRRAKSLKRRLAGIGEVNPLAIQEYEESKERYEFHSEQQSDLEESVADLRSAIERMDRESRRRFRETFEAVNEQFQTVFPRLFRGGKARLILTEPDDILQTGVDIEVQPPGKKLQNVSLLSGGEKALTAVSLIFAIFTLKPSPFAILDEVDAPLDDANVGRFAEMIAELSKESQMILITHNRRTMETPDRLYGVTMEEAGISKVVSVELSDVDDRLAS